MFLVAPFSKMVLFLQSQDYSCNHDLHTIIYMTIWKLEDIKLIDIDRLLFGKHK